MSKKQKPTEEIEVNDEMVLAAATDINTVLAPNPLLDLEKPGEELQKEVEELFPNIMKDDALSKETWTTLAALGWKAAEAPKIEKPKASKPEKASEASGAVKTLKEKKTEKAVTILGSRLGSQAEKIDIALLKGKGKTKEELAKETGFSVGRISIHLSHLIGKKKLKIEGEKGKYSATHLKG